MSHLLFIFVLCTGNNNIIKQRCYLLLSLSKKYNDNSLNKYTNPALFIKLKYMLKYTYKLKIICFNWLTLKYVP